MNKLLAWLPPVVILGIVLYKLVKDTTKSELLNRAISFAVYKGSSYSSEIYNNTSVQIRIRVEKVSTKGQRTIVWNKTLDKKSLSYYPSPENALKHNIIIAGINEKKEYLVVQYTLTYNSKGSELQMQDCTVVYNNDSSKVDIRI